MKRLYLILLLCVMILSWEKILLIKGQMKAGHSCRNIIVWLDMERYIQKKR